MKGVDAIGPLLEPTPQAGEGPAKTKDGKQFDAVLADVVENDPARAKGAKGIAPTAEKTAQLADKALPAAARSIHTAALQGVQPEVAVTPETVATPKLEALEEVEEPTKLEEPKTPQQDQVVLGQVASVVARIVAPPQAAVKQEVKATSDAKVAQPALPSPPPANDVAPPVRAQDFNDALHGVQIVPHDAHEAQTVRPGVSESTAPAAGEEARGPIGRALQALKGDSAPMRAAADKVMNAFRALSGREQAPATTTTPTVSTPAAMQSEPSAVPATPNVAAATHTITFAGNEAPAPTAAPTAAPTTTPAAAPAVTTPAQARVSTTASTLSSEMPTVRPGAPQPRTPAQTITVSAPTVPGQPALPAQPQPTQAVPTQAVPTQAVPTQAAPAQAAPAPAAPAPQGQAVPAQPMPGQAAPAQAVQGQTQALSSAPAEQTQPTPQTQPTAQAQPGAAQANVVVPQQAANTNATQPVVVQVQPQPEAASEEAVREQAADKSEGEPRERVHGFSRSGWTDQARSAYGGRGHEGSSSDRGSERGETARTIKREDERASERAGEEAAPQFLPEQFMLEPQLTQAPQQAQESPNANVPQNQPAAPAAPVQELPDIVFQGRADPTAATENASISLHHPDLGPIQLEVHREQGRVEVHAVIESQHAQAVLRANESGIRQGVQQAGMTFNALRVRVRGEEQPGNNRPGQERRRRNEREK